MATTFVTEKWSGEISTVFLGASAGAGGTRARKVAIGGEKTLPFLTRDGAMPHQPIVALEVWDCPAADWPAELTSAYGDCLQDPYAWAENCVKRFGAELLYLRLQGTHPDFGAKSASEAAAFVAALLGKVQVPLIITGCGDPAIDNAVLPEVSEAAKGEKCLLGSAVQDNYKTLVGAALRDGHAVIAESPIDVNIAKQLNILISDMGLALDRIVMDPTIGALGYGLEYAYSIMERARLAALSGDKTLALPFICFVGQETWKTKEAVVPESSVPSWGNACERGILWETATATALLQSGADILVMRHPLAAKQMKKYIQDLCL